MCRLNFRNSFVFSMNRKATDMNNLRISLIQSDLYWEDKIRNLDTFRNLLLASQTKADIFLLPEMFSTGFTMNPNDLAESVTGETVSWMKELASTTNALIAGSIVIKEDGHFFNRFLAVSSHGIIASYNKRHLFRMAGEESHYTRGSERIIFSWRGWRILPQICYDIRFPVWIRNRQDYDLALFVANWPEPRRDVWMNLLKARALENQAYIAGVNRIGTDNKGVFHSGDSLLLDPKGSSLAEAGNRTAVITADLSMPELNRFRQKFPAHLDQDDFLIQMP